MTIIIDNKSGVPIYDQIYSQIKVQIIGDALRQDEALPSIRSLAKDLRISVITTKRAYEGVGAEGFVCARPGKGSFVAPKNTELLREENLRRLEEHMREISALAVQSGLTRQELSEMYTLISEEELT